MSAPIFHLSREACAKGGAKGGQYLQSINQTDLAKLNVAQFEHFCAVLVGGAWSAALDDHISTIKDDEPPF